MKGSVIIDSVRTAIGRTGGTLKDEEIDFHAAKVIQEIVSRVGVDPAAIDEVILGQAKQSSDAPNLARLAALRTGLPVDIPGCAVHRKPALRLADRTVRPLNDGSHSGKPRRTIRDQP